MRKAILISLLLTSFAARAQTPNVTLTIDEPVALNESNQATWTVRVSNPGHVPTGDLTVHFLAGSFPVTGELISLPPGCVREPEVACTVNVAPSTSIELPFVMQYSGRFGYLTSAGRIGSVRVSKGVVFAHEYPVTTTADSGPGSLRQAILDMNRDCSSDAEFSFEPCGPVFRIDGPVPQEGWFTIRPLAPLPGVTAVFSEFDGRTQSRYTGDTNESGPEIMIDGSAAGVTTGLEFTVSAGRAAVKHLAIGNFNGNAVESNAGEIALESVYLGLHPSGVRAASNSGRGIQVNRGATYITRSYLSANGRAGAYINGRLSSVANNFIGVGIDGVTPLGNGASGLYFQKWGGYPWEYHGASGNVIANNGHAGIGFRLEVMGDFGANTFLNNRGPAIDAGMDGPTPESRPGLPSLGGVLAAPRIDSAEFKDGVTTIAGNVGPRLNGSPVEERLYVYASRDSKEGGELIGSTQPDRQTGAFTLVVPRDLRGYSVSASYHGRIHQVWDDTVNATSEVGAPRLVQ